LSEDSLLDGSRTLEPVSVPMNDHDSRALEDIRAWQGRKPSRRLRSAIPAPVRDRAGELVVRGKAHAGQVIGDVPGSEQIKQALLTTLEGATRTIGAGAAASVSTSLVIRRYRRAGHPIERIEDIQDLELAASDRVFPRRKRLAYVAASGAEGAAAGAAMTVSGTATVVTGVFGVGAGGVPTAIVTAGVMAGDIAATLMTASRIVAETSALYGYDPNDPVEQVFMTGVLGAATATSEGAKLAAQRELRELAKLLARRAPYRLLDKSAFTHVVRKAYAKLGEKMTQKQLGKVVPVTSIVVGAGMNAALMHRTADEACYAYRQRRLQDRYDLDPSGHDHDLSEGHIDVEVVDDSEEGLDLIGLLDQATRESDVDEEVFEEGPGRSA
jgi:hypothetical protein